jgi:TM2 domain-containing membrane protein YozV
MLNQAAVDQQEEALRLKVRQLEDAQRVAFYEQVKPRLRDPDTYAALNWFFISGIHHFYLGRWIWGIVDLLALATGVGLIAAGYMMVGFAVIIALSLVELWALFRAQLIVQNWNNGIYRAALQQITAATGET